MCITSPVYAEVDDLDVNDLDVEIAEASRIDQKNVIKLKPSYKFRLSESWTLELGVKLNLDYSEQPDVLVTGYFFNITYYF